MKLKKLAPSILIVTSVVTLFFSFQNCSDVGFSEMSKITLDAPVLAVDKMCFDSGDQDQEDIFLPFVPISPVNLPSDCMSGIEINNLKGHRIELSSAQGTHANRKLRIEFATYVKADSLAILAEDLGGEETYIFAQCRVQTWSSPDPTDGHSRPPDDTIRYTEILIPSGTRKLIINTEAADSPFYIRLQGLCDFDRDNIDVQPSIPIGFTRGSIRNF